MDGERPVCEKCAAPASVHISNQIPTEGMVIRHFCLDCAESYDGFDATATIAGDHRLSDAAGLIVAGACVLLLSLLADWLRLGGSGGFGYQQIGGLLVGAGLMLLGAILRALTLLVFGAITAVLSLVADLFPVGGAEGFGTNQIVGTVLGLALIGVGIVRARGSRRSRPRG